MPFDATEFRRKFEECCDIAEGIKRPLEVRAVPRIQADREILVGRCPVRNCGSVAALSGEGRHLCRKCGTWLRYVRVDDRQSQKSQKSQRSQRFRGGQKSK